ncbi:MAG: radical SAM protein, partial [Candidatus Bathyarchaeia archaeon]
MIPITHYGNVDGFINSMKGVYEESDKGHETRLKMKLISSMRHINFGMLRKYIWTLLKTGSYNALGDIHRKMLMVSSMHFMDPYNFDLERVQRCCIHYAVPDGRIIPFCTMNSIHRSKIEKNLGIPIEEWKQAYKKDIDAVA